MLCKTLAVKAITIAVPFAVCLLIISFCVRHTTFVTSPTQTIIPEEDTIHIVRVIN